MHGSSALQPSFLLLFLLTCAGCAQTDGQVAGGNQNQPADVMNVADAAISGGDPSMALKVSQSVLANDPNNLDALYHEGAAYYALNRCMDAIAVYKVALTVDPKSAEAETGIGRCLLRRNAAQAELAFTAAVQDDPDNADALNDLGIARDLQGNHAGAVQPYQQALILKPGDIATEVNLGMSLALAGDGDDALQYLGPLATSDEATPKIREDYAAALVAAGRVTEARSVLSIDLPPAGVDQLVADIATAIAASQPPVSAAAAAAPAAAPATTAPAEPAPVQATPLAAAIPAAVTPTQIATAPPAAAPIAPAPAVAAAAPTPPPTTAPSPAPTVSAPIVAAMSAPAPVVTPTVVTSAPPPAAMPPTAIPTESLASPPPQVTPPPGASTTTSNGTAAADSVVR
jgi:Flp pilus assembly protein TadD